MSGFFFLVISFQGFAALPEDVLKTAWTDPRTVLHQEAVAIVSDADSLNPIDKAELRLDQGQLTQQDVKVGLRVYPRGFSEYRTALRFQEALEKNERAAQSESLSRLLAARYDLLARMALLKEKKEISSELSKISRKTSRALSYSAQKNRAELKSYLKTKGDLDKIDLKIADIDRDYQGLQEELKRLSLAPAEKFDLSTMATVDDLRERLDAVGLTVERGTLSAKVADLDLEKSRAGIAYERARDDKWLDHVEISVKDDKGEKVYGIAASFNLPFVGAPDLSRIDKEARELREKGKLVETLQTTELALQGALTELRGLLALHRSLRESQLRLNPEQMRKASQAVAATDPMLAIELQRGWYESREQMLDLEFRIRTLYVAYLHESSAIAGNPEINFLSKTPEKRIL